MTTVAGMMLGGLGVALLAFGAEYFVRGAASLARRLGVSAAVVGMTIVGFGTSVPELAVNLSAAQRNATDICLGNVVGSNIANIGLILAIAALVRPLATPRRLLVADTPLMIAVSLAVWALAADGMISRVNAVFLLGAFLIVLAYFVFSADSDLGGTAAAPSAARPPLPLATALFLSCGGLAALILGADLLVRAAIDLARGWGISEWVIGVTIVAIGTSLPELAASVVAAYRGEAALAVGNVVGSNLFNLLLVLGVTALVKPLPVADHMVYNDIPIMTAFAVGMLLCAGGDHRIGRLAGVALLLAYLAFLAQQLG